MLGQLFKSVMLAQIGNHILLNFFYFFYLSMCEIRNFYLGILYFLSSKIKEQFQDLDLQIGSVHIRLGAVQFRKNVVDFILISNYSTGTIFAIAVGNGKQINVQTACHLADFSDDRVCFL